MSSNSNATTLNHLPEDTLRHCLGLLDVRSRCVASCVCSRSASYICMLDGFRVIHLSEI